MADNTLQFDWIAKIKGGLDVVFQDNPDVFVAGNLFWYPVEERNRRRLAPDAMVIFGRPKGYRTSYVQHHEDGIPPQVVFEVLSPGNRKRVMDYKRNFYERYGVEEYYVFDPYKIKLEVWLREGDVFLPIAETSNWTSPRLGIRFELAENMTIFDPDGRPFLDFTQVARQRDESQRQSKQAEKQLVQARRKIARVERQVARVERQIALADQQAEIERERAALADRQAEVERQRAGQAEQLLETERQKAEAERQKAARLAAKLRELGIEPEG